MKLNFAPLFVVERFDVLFPEGGRHGRLIVPSGCADDVVVNLCATPSAEAQILLRELERWCSTII